MTTRNKIPYEFHVTVNLNNSDVEEFKTACQKIGVKPILLDLHLDSGACIKDMMTSSTIMGTDKEAFEELNRISTELTEFGFDIVRRKIETVPWHPNAPTNKGNTTMPEYCYFECHLKTKCNHDNRPLLAKIASTHKAHLSSNVFKKIDNENFSIMITLREYDSVYESFLEHLHTLNEALENNNFQVEKEIVEFSMFDSKVQHDSAWINENDSNS